MMTLRPAIPGLVLLGPFPSSEQCDQRAIDAQAALLSQIQPAVTDEEARALITLFGPDDYFGGAWTLVHLIESAPGWPLAACLREESNEWIVYLRQRAERGGWRDAESGPRVSGCSLAGGERARGTSSEPARAAG